MRGPNLSSEIKEKIISLYGEGYTFAKIGEMLHISLSTGASFLKRVGIQARSPGYYKNISLDEDFFETIDNEIKAYWLGFLFADGNITRNIVKIALKSDDKEHLIKFNNSLSSSSSINFGGYIRNEKRYYNCNTYFGSKKVVSDLAKYNLIPNKSLIANPRLDLINKDLHSHFWRGMIDGDGCISRVKSRVDKNKYLNSWYFALCGSRFVIDQFHSFCGMTGYIKPNRNIWYIVFSGKKSIAPILHRIYGNSSIYLTRKYELYLQFKDLNPELCLMFL